MSPAKSRSAVRALSWWEVTMSEPVVDFEDTVPEVDDVLLTGDEPLPDVVENVPAPEVDSEEFSDVSDFEDIEELPDIPGGDFINRRSGFVER